MGARGPLDQLAAAGIELSSHGDQIIARPGNRLDDRLRALIRDNKATLLDALARPSPRVELLGLIRAVGSVHGFTDDEVDEALDVGIRKIQDALTSYRAEAKRLGVSPGADDRVTCGECRRLVMGRCEAARMRLMADTQENYSPVPDGPRNCQHYLRRAN